MGSKFSGRAFCEQDIQIITEEVLFLVEGGFRPNDKAHILGGLEYALDHMKLEEWRIWLHYPLRKVVTDLTKLGVEHECKAGVANT